MQIDNRTFFDEVTRQLAAGRQVAIRMKGHSMRPLLRDSRDTAVVAPYGEREVRRGDVVLFRSGGNYVLHRVVQRKGPRLTLAGDGNYLIREECPVGEVLGRLERVVRSSGRSIACDGWHWRWQSRAWLLLPAIVRRYTLAVLWRLGIR